ncbi:tRNA (adenosine(37)-N6)-threonylcarbamoyltransferase complex ATPase subunit type 1 TsaE [Microbacterium sp. G2-8]|uniref:tRNA (adenosine(37)-N6)-threonylcarbamoyltransferase complex ATPase subunit type 1 TsaE n=1 Tax=Microbacterium sp. G2-8 TaxID=2842454 RepID=UPI001C8A916B|nr:tRNA (adenosine(37)-N6)-threonylcarbamoyltransferase complex ATPase subunit type 1 TsaE [Microbacterium sp. G2-8]
MIPDDILGTRDVATSAEMEALGRRIGAQLVAGDVLVLTGPLGAGKTTLTRGIAEGLGVRGPVQSPTFVIARTHPSLTGGAPLVHADAYRLGDASELEDLDLDLDGSVTIVEWGRGAIESVADEWWDIEIARPTGDAEEDPENLDLDAPRTVVVTKCTLRDT